MVHVYKIYNIFKEVKRYEKIFRLHAQSLCGNIIISHDCEQNSLSRTVSFCNRGFFRFSSLIFGPRQRVISQKQFTGSYRLQRVTDNSIRKGTRLKMIFCRKQMVIVSLDRSSGYVDIAFTRFCFPDIFHLASIIAIQKCTSKSIFFIFKTNSKIIFLF